MKAYCMICHTVIETKSEEDFVTCTCGQVSMEGLKPIMIGNPGNYMVPYEEEPKNKKRRSKK